MRARGQWSRGVDGSDADVLSFQGRAKLRAKEQEVLDVAAAYFLKHGYQGASINAMARSSGISKESIYRYFSSKKELFEAVIVRELRDYQAKLRRLDSALESMDLRSALVTLGATILRVITADRTLALRRLIFEEATRSPDLGLHYHAIGPEQARRTLERVFAFHRVDSAVEPRALSAYFAALISWPTMLERECALCTALSEAELERRVTAVVDDFMRAFLPAV